MATKIYDSANIQTIDGIDIYITPLKIKFLRQFLQEFENVKSSKGDEDAISNIVKCVVIAMKQYYPIIDSEEKVEDSFDMPTIYKILDIAAGIDLKPDSEDDSVLEQAKDSGASWDDLDLAKLESEVFLIGIWKDFEELETSLSMPELVAILESKREADYNDKKFMAAMQGVDLDKQVTKSDPWQDMKARVFSGGKASSSTDVVSLQGINASKAGFGIGMGLDYEDLG